MKLILEVCFAGSVMVVGIWVAIVYEWPGKSEQALDEFKGLNRPGFPRHFPNSILCAMHECCSAKHQNIAASKKKQPFKLSVLQRLVPENQAQAAIKESLIAWHKNNISSRLWFLGWA